MFSRGFLALVAVLVALHGANACIYVYGTAPNSLAKPSSNKYTFAMQGLDWTGECATGVEQSPIDFPKAGNSGYSSGAPRTGFAFADLVSDGENLQVINTGHNIQVQWASGFPHGSEIHVPHRGQPDSTVHDVLNYPASEMTATAKGFPIQFHLHTKSEHTMEGMYAALELHIVNLVPQSEMAGCPETPGCIVPVGVMFKEVEEGDNPVIEQILKWTSMREGQVTIPPAGETIDLSKIIPSGGDGKYLQYAGGLTTPPCMEGFLWHVFTPMSYVSRAQMNRIMEIMAFKECEENPNATDSGMRKLSTIQGAKTFMLPEEQIEKRSTFIHNSDASAVRRSLLQEDEDEEYVCKVAAFGFNNRRVMPIGARKIYRYAKA